MTPKPINLLLVDDHTLFRKALYMLVRTFKTVGNIHESSSGKDAIQKISSHSIDIVLMDIQMPELGGIETLRQIKQISTKTKVVMLTQFCEESLILYAIECGANGFLLKSVDPSELEKAISEVALIGHYFHDASIEVVGKNEPKTNRESNLRISPREFQVLVLLKDGKSNKEVANAMGLTIRTVESYRKNLIKKTGSRNTVDLVSMAYRTGMLAR